MNNDVTASYLHKHLGWDDKKIASSLGVGRPEVQRALAHSDLFDGLTRSKIEKFESEFTGDLEKSALRAKITLPQAVWLATTSNTYVIKTKDAARLLDAQGFTLDEISTALKTTNHKAQKLIGLPMIDVPLPDRITVNDKFFNKIDHAVTAYWFGFMIADGWVTSDGKKVGLKLNAPDKPHLETFANDLDYQGGIYDYLAETNYGKIEYAILNIVSPQLNLGLVNAGCLPNKSKMGSTPILARGMERDCLRGIIDGAGMFSKNTKKISLVAAKPTIDWVVENSYAKPSTPRQIANYTWEINWYGAWASDQVSWLYDKPQRYLERKYMIASEWK